MVPDTCAVLCCAVLCCAVLCCAVFQGCVYRASSDTIYLKLIQHDAEHLCAFQCVKRHFCSAFFYICPRRGKKLGKQPRSCSGKQLSVQYHPNCCSLDQFQAGRQPNSHSPCPRNAARYPSESGLRGRTGLLRALPRRSLLLYYSKMDPPEEVQTWLTQLCGNPHARPYRLAAR
jgi:hypothetical protein